MSILIPRVCNPYRKSFILEQENVKLGQKQRPIKTSARAAADSQDSNSAPPKHKSRTFPLA
jgi:hypothetical protein